VASISRSLIISTIFNNLEQKMTVFLDYQRGDQFLNNLEVMSKNGKIFGKNKLNLITSVPGSHMGKEDVLTGPLLV
jgi:hypothetical protein